MDSVTKLAFDRDEVENSRFFLVHTSNLAIYLAGPLYMHQPRLNEVMLWSYNRMQLPLLINDFVLVAYRILLSKGRI